jgi:ABC-type transporter Mla subunit MlaD
MVGAVTVLIAIVAVFLAYNANNGLPFVPVYRVSVEVPNAARVGNNNEIRIGGTRVGVVESIEPVADEDAGVTAQAEDPAAVGAGEDAGDLPPISARLNLKLDESAKPLPQDSIFRVRYRSSFGLKYIEVVRGTGPPAPEGYVFDGTDDVADANGETSCPLPMEPETFAETSPEQSRNGCFQTQTEFDAINNTFDAETRENNRRNLVGFGGAFAARGASLNDAIQQFEPLFTHLEPVSKALSDPSTRFRNFFPALARAADIAAPVATEQADMFSYAATTFAAISEDPEALQDSIETGHPTFETGIRTLPAQTVFLRDLATFSRELNPGARDLRVTLPVLNEAIDTGTPVLHESPKTNRKLKAALRELEELVEQPTTRTTLMRLAETFDEARPLAEWVAPAQTVCNYWNYWFTFLPNAISDRDPLGFALRQTLTRFPSAPTQVQTGLGGYSGVAANGRSGTASPKPGEFRPYELPILQTHPYGATGQRNADCQYGQYGYAPVEGQLLTPGQDPSNPAHRTSDLPGSRGPTTLFFGADKERSLYDSRVASRSPESWRRLP